MGKAATKVKNWREVKKIVGLLLQLDGKPLGRMSHHFPLRSEQNITENDKSGTKLAMGPKHCWKRPFGRMLHLFVIENSLIKNIFDAVER